MIQGERELLPDPLWPCIAKKKELADDGLLAQNVIAQLRNFVEAIAIKIYSVDHEVELNQDGTKQAIKNIKRNDDLVFLKRFSRIVPTLRAF